jgi:hypothetical protein
MTAFTFMPSHLCCLWGCPLPGKLFGFWQGQTGTEAYPAYYPAGTGSNISGVKAAMGPSRPFPSSIEINNELSYICIPSIILRDIMLN